jgi:hypothetical protein
LLSQPDEAVLANAIWQAYCALDWALECRHSRTLSEKPRSQYLTLEPVKVLQCGIRISALHLNPPERGQCAVLLRGAGIPLHKTLGGFFLTDCPSLLCENSQ